MLKELRERELGLTPPGRHASTVRRSRIRALELSKYRDIVTSNQTAINSLQVDAVERRYLLSGAGNAAVAVYDLEDPARVENSEVHKPLCCIARASPGGHKFSVSSVQWYTVDTGMFITGSFDESVSVWDTNALEVIRHFKLPGKVHSISMSPVASSHMLVAAGTEDVQVRLCDISSGAFTHTLSGHRDAVCSVKWSASSEWILISGGRDGAIRLWDIRRTGCFYVFDQHRSRISQTSEESIEREPGGHPGMASTSDRATAHYGTVTALEATPDGHFLISAGSDMRVRLWDMNNGWNTLVNYHGTPLPGRNRHVELAISMDASLVFVPSRLAVQAFDLWSGQLVTSLKGHLETVNCCTLETESQRLYSGGNDRQILSWESQTSREDEKPEVRNTSTITALRPDEDNWSD